MTSPAPRPLLARLVSPLKHRYLQWIALGCMVGGGLLGFVDPVYTVKIALPGLLLYALIDLGEPSAWQARPTRRASALEKLYLLVLIVACAAIYTYRLGDLPPGYHGHEVLMAADLGPYEFGPYKEHNSTFDADWPSLVFYQGVAASKVLGHNPAAYRVPSVLWTLLAVLAFYFLARSMLSVGSAMLATPLFALNATLLVWTRNFFPGTVLLFGELAALYFLLRAPADGRRRWAYFAAGGVALSLCLRGYVPGRLTPACFVAWMPFWLLSAEGRRRDGRGLALFWAAFAASIASLVIWYFNGGASTYWAYVRTMDPTGGHGLMGHLRLLFNNLPHYIRYFTLLGDADGPVPFAPLLPPMVGVLFVLGLWIALRRPWQKAVVILPMLLLAGVAPAALGGTFSHPSSRRSMLAIPIAYLLFAVGFEAVRRAFGPLGKAARAAAAAVLSLLFLPQAAYSLWSYFDFNSKDPAYLYNHDLTGVQVRQIAHKTGTHDVWMHTTRPIGNLLTFWDIHTHLLGEPEDALRGPRGQDALLILDPLDRSALPFLRAALPAASVESRPNPFLQLKTAEPDAYSPWRLFWALHAGAADWSKVGVLTLRAQDGERALTLQQASSLSGPYELAGSVLGPRGGAQVQASFDAASGSLWIDQREVRPGRAFYLPGGVNRLRYKATARGGVFALKVLRAFPVNEIPELVYLPFAWEHGLRLLVHGVDPAQEPLEIRHPYAEYRFGTLFHRDAWRWEFDGAIEWPEDGRFELGAFKRCGLRVWADGKEVFCNQAGLPPVAKALTVRKGQRSRLRIDYSQAMDNNPQRAFQLLWKRPGRGFVPVPVESLYFE